MKSLLVRLIGFPATLIHSDTMVWDRWRWLKKRLRIPRRSANLLEVGCGTGAFTIGAALLGYRATGLSWDLRNQTIAAERARMCGANKADFLVRDARKLGEEVDQKASYDVVICLECIEHILNDEKLMRDLSACLKEGGQLLLTTPNINYRPLTAIDNGPWSAIEDGGHVRKGYSEERLRELCRSSGLCVKEVSYCSGVVSQKITRIYRLCATLNRVVAWLLILPLRVLPPILDGFATHIFRWPCYSICLEAWKDKPKD
jgi:2-polyprenyl-3-methyl-5-hydroxy-6-metoxy-1,4-benzoquinol methylase